MKRAYLAIVAATMLVACESLMPVFQPTQPAPVARDMPGVKNVVSYHGNLRAGGAPQDGEGFATLQRLGVRTIISVDGGIPDTDAAAAYGFRYIHLPLGYDGIDRDAGLRLARAVRDSAKEGGVYLHCHHGKHRCAAAAGTASVMLGWETSAAMVDRMRVSGASSHYPGLYASVAGARRESPQTIDSVNSEFPPVTLPTGLVSSMADLGRTHEHLTAIEDAAWGMPLEHPDLVPAAEAGRLVDTLRLLEVDPLVHTRNAGFKAMLGENRRSAERLEDMILSDRSNPAMLSVLLGHVTASCTACHERYRN
ncbi:MAG: hypothetical protein QGH76_03065 [Phycisphaerales bacterium]|nr:hypothetical protein [Phycisphaerales bacterium]